MKVILPNFSSEDCIDIAGLTTKHLVVAFKNGRPFGVLCTDADNVEYWIQSSMEYDMYSVDVFNTIYETIENFVKKYPDVTFEAYL